ncbi:Excalibur calcium-binding domain-containing protein [Blastococcus sp. DSM 46786]|uniref:excalibur calcium-binding domain-containing protein n=1 Tax=Blastococcus sp. DSM 46786 TaxID=1798227 RepID=UPI0008CAFE5A|nr:excalibur calcium-binding domain-containing protein [Blastococcus sp. DSM 46786]SEM09367.1 Excalibur calcium-binding domain-containing protein [Blastococcus sp. DSM 46786]
MSDTAVMPGAPAPVPANSDKSPKRWLKWAIPLMAFLVGIAVGGGGNSSEVEASPAYLTLKSELTETQQEAAELEDEVVEAESRIRRATAEGESRLAARVAELDARSAALDQREGELVAREAAASAAPAPQATVRSTAPAPSASPAPVAPAPAPQAPRAYYKNCDAARAAGAAPVRVGDPGYAGHLDRDGDGVGCE